MTGQHGDRSKLGKLHHRLERWRQQHGGPGRPIPGELWDEAAVIARAEGVDVVARTLRVDRLRLAGRVEFEAGTSRNAAEHEHHRFVELDASRLCQPAKTVLRFEGRDGERMEVELGDAARVDVMALASAFWSRGR